MDKNNKMPMVTHGNGNQGEATRAVRRNGKQDVNLRKRGFLRFQIGLILALILVYAGLEASFRMQKEYAPPPQEEMGEIFIYEAELPPVRVDQEQKVIVKKMKSPRFVPVPDDTELAPPEDFIDLPRDPIADPNLSVPDIPFEEPEEEIKVPYIAVEEKPVFPGCERVKEERREKCFQEKMNKHIQRVFRYPEIDRALGNSGKVNVFFIIDKNGEITDIRMKGPSKTMENEAERIIQKLPKMTPGKQRDKPVKVSFHIPINFQLN
ncbi:MAG: energy transducer TonB [Flavobacteriaceae bacterium]